MPAPYSTGYQAHLQGVIRGDPELVLLEITHPDLAAPVRVVNDSENLVSGGNTYIAAPFQLVLPDDRDRQTPRAQLQITNVGRELMQWLEVSNGGRGALCRIRQVRKSLPNNIELDVTVALQSVVADMGVVAAELGFDSLLDRAAIGLRFDPETTPGLF